MADHRITDFVDQAAIDRLKELNTEMQSIKVTYVEVADALLRGLSIRVNGVNDIDAALRSLVELQRRASESTTQLTRNMAEQGQIAANTTNTIQRELMVQERVNKTVREEYTEQERVKKLLEEVNGTYDNRVKALINVTKEIEANKAAQKELDKQMKSLTPEEYSRRQLELVKIERQLKQEKANLVTQLKNEEREMASVEGSYNHLSQQLELLKKAYKNMTDEEKNSPVGKEMEETIQNLDAHLKDMAADMGEFQRNVGNYAIACNNGIVVTEDLNRVLGMEAGTIAGCIEQNKELEKAKLHLSTADASYAETLDLINAKIEENKRRIADVDAILWKEAASVAEAEAQNKQLTEALKQLDLTSAGAEERVKLLNAKIAANKKIIEDTTPALQDHAKASEGLIDKMASMVGINTQLGSSFKSLGEAAKSNGSVVDGLGVKVKAFGQTLMGLLSNPWVLTFLGIAGIAAGFKWWYDYNKGLIEASRLTENFTGKTGEAADKVTTDMQTLADKMGKTYSDTISAANTLVQQFGVTWEQAYKLMQDGIAAGADMSGNMLANIERFGPSLRDAGVSADQLMAILSETRNGIFNEQGIQNIQKAGTKLRAMTKQTEEALDAVGISAKKMQSDLEAGNITMIEAVQQVAAKLKELPENSQQAGQIMKNVFGRTAAEGGTLLIQSIADVCTNLDEAKDKMGELGRVNEEQMEAQRRLNEILNSVFKMSGTSFETLITQAKTFITKGIIKIIEGCVGIVNWFIRLYKESIVVRGAFNSIVNSFKTIWEVGKFVINQIIDSFKALGTVIEGVLTLDIDKIVSGYKQGLNALKANVTDMVKTIISNTNESIKNTINDEIGEIKIGFSVDSDDNNSSNRVIGGGNNRSGNGGSGSGKGSTKDTEKEEIKRLNDLEEAKIKAMEDGHEKEMATIKHNYMKKIREIRGESKEEVAIRIELMVAMYDDLFACEEKYQKNIEKINLANRLAAIKKGSEEEYDLKLQQLDAQYRAEIEEAEKTGADVSLIYAKYEQQRRELREEYAGYRMKDIQDRYAGEQALAETQLNAELARLKRALNDELAAVGDNAEKREEIQRKYDDKVAELQENYAQSVIMSNIDMYKEILQNEDLSAEERAAIQLELLKLEIELENAKADAVASANDRILANDKRTTEKRMANMQTWLKNAADGLNAIMELANALNERKIQNIEAEQEANNALIDEEQERASAETEIITELVNKKVISQEEGEARKRAAEAKTAEKRAQIEKKNEELEKKKQQLQYRQAVWDKANKLAQTGISTALGIMQTIASVGFPAAIPMIAVVGALGALQLATILATPIPKYKSGTDNHKGGLAIVGDGGKAEVIFSNGEYYVTPDQPTLVDIPQGAKVYPDADRFIDETVGLNPHLLVAGSRESASVNVDFTRLERKIESGTDILKAIAYQQRGQHRAIADALYHAEFDKIKNSL